MSNPRPEQVFVGQAASHGLACGLIDFHRRKEIRRTAHGTPYEERNALDRALTAAAAQLLALAERSGDEGGAILEFQIALLEDPELLAPVHSAIAAGRAASDAWDGGLARQISDYETAEDDYFRARALDLADLRGRVLRALGDGDEALLSTSEDAIYVGADLTPSRFLEIDWNRYRGGALTEGSAAGHVAILARSRGVPLVIGLAMPDAQIVSGAAVILDAEDGKLIQDPSPGTRAGYERRIAARQAAMAAEAEYLTRPAVLHSGERVQVQINVDEPRLLDGVDPTHCDGIGLTRTEFLFSGPSLPDEESQYRVYARLLDWAAGRPVTIRTLDAGGDKPIAGLTPDDETNPFLGLRGLRLSLTRPDVFGVQLRALLRAATRGNLKVMVPMVTAPREMSAVRAMFEAEAAALARAGVEARMPHLGMMVEVPAAAINVAAFDADFLSIGSNDLTQYVTATSRDCTAVSALHDALDPAVLELIGRVVRHGFDSGREVSLCGDMASDPRGLTALLDLGLRSLSVAPARLAQVKAGIARHG